MAGELRSLQAAPGNLALLETLQWRLIDRIKMAERHLRRYRLIVGQLKTRLRSRLSKDTSLAVKDAISRANDGIDGLQYKARVWRVFGDGIAHIYLDKYALKQTFYNATDFEPKEDPGFLDGKDGFVGEWAVVVDAIREGIPTLLADMTNIIRHGDVCLMGELTPVLIEIKKSGNQNMRTARQSRSLETIQSFLQTDVSTELRGVGPVVRRSLPDDEVSHYRHINDAMREARTRGWAVVQPEPGVVYACSSVESEHDRNELLEALGAVFGGSSKPQFVTYSLSDARLANAWGHYTPYVLSLDPLHAGLFIGGRMWTAVFVDMTRVVELFAECGFVCSVLPDGPWLLQLETYVDGKRTGASRISGGLVARIAFDFQSLQWFVRTQAAVTVEGSDMAEVDWTQPIVWPELPGT